ncbi:MAG: hypothetical protein PHE12_02985 [Clostridia bacterium]|nr:hypothetical protein [Clostridia bacterium]
MNNLKKATKIILAPLVIVLFTVFVMPHYFADTKSNKPPLAKIAQLWHVDMFEGGSGSRSEFLKRRAIEYEKDNPARYILIKSMTYQQIINNLSEGQCPDMFSFGQGLACDLLSEIAAYEGNIAVYDNMLSSGVIENKLFAVPWCTGAYIIAGINEHISGDIIFAKELACSSKNNLYSFITGYSQFNNPLLAAYLANKSISLGEKSLDSTKHFTQLEAYSRFISKNYSVFLLGTQRDYVRISGRENASDFSFQTAEGYSDLVCYMGICKKTINAKICTDFIEYVLSEKSQKKLTEINMFSVNISNVYKDTIMKQSELKIKDNLVLNAFISKEILEENKALSYGALTENLQSVEKIKQMLPY